MSSDIPLLPPKRSSTLENDEKGVVKSGEDKLLNSAHSSLVIHDLTNPVSLFPSDKLKEFQESIVLLKGYSATLLESKNEKHVALLEKQIQEMDSIVDLFNSLNSGEQKDTINGKLADIKQLELEFGELEKVLFNKIQNYQVQYKDILRNKLENEIKEKEDLKSALFHSAEKDTDIDNFVKQYKESCVKLHLLTEFQKRLNEDRIGGVI